MGFRKVYAEEKRMYVLDSVIIVQRTYKTGRDETKNIIYNLRKRSKNTIKIKGEEITSVYIKVGMLRLECK